MLEIKVLGPGCRNCAKLEATAREVAAALAVETNIEKISDYPTIMSYGVLSTPGLVVNGRLVSSGRVPSSTEVTDWLTAALTESTWA